MLNFRLTLWNAEGAEAVLARTLAPNPDVALVQLSSALALERLEVCSEGEGQDRIERLSDDGAAAEIFWEVRSAAQCDPGEESAFAFDFGAEAAGEACVRGNAQLAEAA
jgi:hypothetical protein